MITLLLLSIITIEFQPTSMCESYLQPKLSNFFLKTHAHQHVYFCFLTRKQKPTHAKRKNSVYSCTFGKKFIVKWLCENRDGDSGELTTATSCAFNTQLTVLQWPWMGGERRNEPSLHEWPFPSSPVSIPLWTVAPGGPRRRRIDCMRM